MKRQLVGVTQVSISSNPLTPSAIWHDCLQDSSSNGESLDPYGGGPAAYIWHHLKTWHSLAEWHLLSHTLSHTYTHLGQKCDCDEMRREKWEDLGGCESRACECIYQCLKMYCVFGVCWLVGDCGSSMCRVQDVQVVYMCKARWQVQKERSVKNRVLERHRWAAERNVMQERKSFRKRTTD